MGRLGRKERRFLAEILYGFIRRDYRRVAEVHFEAGYVPHIHRVEDFAQALRAIGEPIHSRTADQISMAKLLTLLFEITALFDMTTRVELVMLQKTMVVVEGVARKLDPQLNMWSTSEPVVGAWIAENLGPRGRLEDAGRSVSSMVAFLSEAPRRLEEIAARLEAAASDTTRKNVSRQPPVCGRRLYFDWVFTCPFVYCNGSLASVVSSRRGAIRRVRGDRGRCDDRCRSLSCMRVPVIGSSVGAAPFNVGPTNSNDWRPTRLRAHSTDRRGRHRRIQVARADSSASGPGRCEFVS